LTDIVLSRAPGDAAALSVKREALQRVLTAAGGENFSEMQWLKQEIKNAATEEDA
jgi:hypothetical protein